MPTPTTTFVNVKTKVRRGVQRADVVLLNGTSAQRSTVVGCVAPAQDSPAQSTNATRARLREGVHFDPFYVWTSY